MENLSKAYNQGSRYENLIMRILLPRKPELKEFYLTSDYVNLHFGDRNPRELGNYEKTLLEKMINSVLPAICVCGDMGSGKTTTLHHLLRYHLKKKVISQSAVSNPNNKTRNSKKTILLGLLDFSSYAKRRNINEEFILSQLILEMRGKISHLIDHDHEFCNYWNYILSEYDELELDTSEVARQIKCKLDDKPDQFHNIEYRKEVYEELKRDKNYNFRYLVLLWKYLSHPISQKKILNDPQKIKISTGLLIIDNLDSLSEKLQRWLYDLIISSANSSGPTFVIFLRPETLQRLGNADNIFDIVRHAYIDPFIIIIDRILKFIDKPEKYYSKKPFLNLSEKLIAIDFLKKMQPILCDPTGAFHDFLSSASGNSIRLGTVISQGILLLSPEELQKTDLSPHVIIRSCIRQGNDKYTYAINSPIENPFKVDNSDTSSVLLKARILRYLYHSSNTFHIPFTDDKHYSDGDEKYKFENTLHDNNNHGGEQQGYGNDLSENELVYHKHSRLLNNLRNDLIVFGYSPITIQEALYQISRDNCQLIFTSGYELQRMTWGDEQEVVYLTKIGLGYITSLIYSPDYLQEIMVDGVANITSIPVIYSDKLADRMDTLWRYLQYLRYVDEKEMKMVLEKFSTPDWYIHNFGDTLLTTPIMQKIYFPIGKILQSAASKYPSSKKRYQEIFSNFESELRLAEKNNACLLSKEVFPIDKFEIN